ncbi:anthranilate synthase component 1 [Agaribacter flavus]|uniref:Anthranilate synthase component 1 n=1 Tax=Agaribacter flavus TaxID=1902781 RepID=A0ABV7FIV3_9ALTE
MSLSALGQSPGTVETISKTLSYIADPLIAYKKVAGENSLLLESAEIDSKDDLKSLILIDAALRIECKGQEVDIVATSENGESLLPFLRQSLGDFVKSTSNKNVLFSFPEPNSNLDEDTRLKQPAVLDVLRTISKQVNAIRDIDHAVFLAGVFAYDLIATFEQLPEVKAGKNTCADYVFYLAETLLLIDHQTKTTELLGSVFSGEDVAQHYFQVSQQVETLCHALEDLSTVSFTENMVDAPSVNCDKSDEEYCKDVSDLQKHILDGDIFQVVPSRTFSMSCTQPLLAYKRLKQTNPSPYMFYIHDKDFVIFGASPESALKYEKATNQVEIYPIAGTRPRGKRSDGSIDLDLDSRLELNLQQDQKEKAEHIMLVDLARNDVAKVSVPGTRFVKDLLKVDRYSHVMHLVSRVVGQLRDDLDALHAYQACMNMGTLVGAPKVSAASLIRTTEKARRGSYGGAVGYFNGHGDFDTCIVIRSAFVQDDIAYVQAGAGVVKDSIPQSEADETRAKAQAVIHAISTANSALSQGEE